MATQLGFAVGLLLLVPLGDRIDRRILILLQLTAFAFSLAAAALAPDARAVVVISALVGITSSVAQQIVPFATSRLCGAQLLSKRACLVPSPPFGPFSRCN
jgi:predicted MFS family arabinose efflux permease